MTRKPRQPPEWLTDLLAESTEQEQEAVRTYRYRVARAHAKLSGGKTSPGGLDWSITSALRWLEAASEASPRFEAYCDWQREMHQRWRRKNLPRTAA